VDVTASERRARKHRAVPRDGGRWIDGEEAGRYRIILMREDSMPPARGLGRRVLNGPPRPHRLFVVVVQWLEQPDSDGPATVRTVAELPLRKDVEWAGELFAGRGVCRWCASVATTRLTHTLYGKPQAGGDYLHARPPVSLKCGLLTSLTFPRPRR